MSDPYRSWPHEAPPPRHDAYPGPPSGPPGQQPQQQQHVRLPPASSLLAARAGDDDRLHGSHQPVPHPGPHPASHPAPYGHPQHQQQPPPHDIPHAAYSAPPPQYANPYQQQHIPPQYQQRTSAPPQERAYVQPPITGPAVYGSYSESPTRHPSEDPGFHRQPLAPPPNVIQPRHQLGPPVPPTPPAPAAAALEPQGKVSGIPNLLDGKKEEAVAGIKFHLRMRQDPKAARACGSGERDRRNVDPPPIVQLHVEAPGLSREEMDAYLRYEGYVMNCWIYDETGTHDASNMPSEYRYQRRLTGSLVGTPFYGKDETGKEGCFFPFPDLSVRTLGKYCLKFTLVMLSVARPGQYRHFPILAETFSGVFEVFTVKDFPGINESSPLVRALRKQGCVISIKKGNDKKKKRGAPASEDEGDGDDDED